MGPLKHIHHTNTSKQHNRPKRKHPNQHLHINLQHISTTNRNKYNTSHRPNRHTNHSNNNNNLQQPHNSRNSIQQHSRNKRIRRRPKIITKTIQGNQLVITANIGWTPTNTFTIQIPVNSIIDQNGNTLTNTYTSTFSTSAPPTVTSITPTTG